MEASKQKHVRTCLRESKHRRWGSRNSVSRWCSFFESKTLRQLNEKTPERRGEAKEGGSACAETHDPVSSPDGHVRSWSGLRRERWIHAHRPVILTLPLSRWHCTCMRAVTFELRRRRTSLLEDRSQPGSENKFRFGQYPILFNSLFSWSYQAKSIERTSFHLTSRIFA